MVHHRKTKVVSGYSTLKAAQRAAEHAREKSGEGAEAPPTPEPSGIGPVKPSIGTHIGHTAMPTKYEIVCYSCTYEFKMSGRTQSTHCPKCRAVVDLSDYTIDSTWTGSVRTGGKIHITSDGVVLSGDLIAGDIRMEGELKGGRLKASRELFLGAGAKLTPDRMSAPNLTILTDAKISSRAKMDYENVTISGHLKGTLKASGLVKISAEGCFSGTLTTDHLEVEDGGGLKATLQVRDLPDEESDDDLVLLKKQA